MFFANTPRGPFILALLATLPFRTAIGQLRVELVHYGEQPYAIDSGDYVELSFSVAPESLSLADLSLTVTGDSFGDRAEENPHDHVRLEWPYGEDSRAARIHLGTNVRLKSGGHAKVARTTAGSPSGLTVRGVGFSDLVDRRVRILQLEFDDRYRSFQNTILKRAESGDSCLHNYYLSYDLEALLSMYEASQATRYLEQAMRFVDIMLDRASDRDDDGYLDFLGTTSAQSEPRVNVALCDWKAGRPIARLARLLDEDPALADRYPVRRERYRSFVDEHLVRKWSRSFNGNAGKMSFANFIESDPLIHRVAHFGDIVVDAWIATGQPDFESLLDSLMGRVCADLQDSELHPGAVEWDIFMRPARSRRKIIRLYERPYDQISDTSHANGTVAFLVAAVLRADRSCEDRDVIADLAFTFRNVITNPPDPEEGVGYRFADFVDGGVLQDGRPPFSIGRFIEDGWLKLGEVDPHVQSIAQAFLDEGQPLHRPQFLGNLARNYSLATWQ